MRTLVTGSNGFIGAHLVERLSARNDQVRCLVLDGEPLHRLKDLGVEIFVGDICQIDTLHEAVKGVDNIYHLAGVKNSWEEDTYFRVNFQGTKNIVEAVLGMNGNLKRFILVSSQAAAGPSPDGSPITEDDYCYPLSYYGKSKLAAEEYLLNMANEIPFTILRPSPVYGSNSSGVSIIGLLIWGARWGVVPQIYDDGPHIMTLHIQDMVEALMLAGEHENGVGQVYFITSERTYSWQEMSELAFRAYNKKRGLTFPMPKSLIRGVGGIIKSYRRLLSKPYGFIDDLINQMLQRYWVCSGDKARRHLGFVPRISLEKGLEEAVQWYRHRRKHADSN